MPHILSVSFYVLYTYCICRAIQILCEGGADHLLTDIEGNFPKDLADKHHHNKCSKYLASLEKNMVPRMKSSNTKKVYITNMCYIIH